MGRDLTEEASPGSANVGVSQLAEWGPAQGTTGLVCREANGEAVERCVTGKRPEAQEEASWWGPFWGLNGVVLQ